MKFTKLIILALIATAGVVVFLPKDAMAEDDLFAGFGATCIGEVLDDCHVISAGYLNKDDGGFDIAFQTQGGSTEYDGSIGNIVLYHYDDGAWVKLAEAHEAYRYSVPEITYSGLLHVEGYSNGTASLNADLLFNTGESETGWYPVNIDSWQGTIGDRLPKGLGIWKGVKYNFNDWEYGIVADTLLWKDDDANCCATGGSAKVVFEIVDQVLTVKDVIYVPPDEDDADN
ncbi:hypothetical protein [Devosia sp. 2618]|uniref:hypothetical protein n=1 Tax=Devosia sp. 2618 TaxID=3156454 RepID=UPI00339A79FC